MSKVNVFVIGAPKCGTTSLVDYLNQMVGVSKMVPKEPYYWSRDIPISKHEIRTSDVESYELLAVDTEADYVIDGSTRYLRSKKAPKLIRDYNPDAKIIIMLRNPVDVAHAYHMEQVFCGHESELSFEKAWSKLKERREGGALPLNCNGYNYLDYENICMFGEQVAYWRSFFSDEQVCVVNFDDFKVDTIGSFKKIVTFLGLDSVDISSVDFNPKNSAHARKNRAVANFLLYRLDFAKPIIDKARIWMNSNPDSFFSGVKKKIFHKEKKRTPLSEELKGELNSTFLSDQELLNEIVGFKHIY